MRRVVSVWFPHWPTDRLRRGRAPAPDVGGRAPAPDAPLVTAIHDGRRRVVAAVDQASAALGLRPGLAMAQALALVPGLDVVEAEPAADVEALRKLARWCHRYTPLASCCAPDGLWLDVAGCAHLFGGEAALIENLLARLARDGLHARAAVADTPGAAHALARHGDQAAAAPGAQGEAIGPLPVGALRLGPELDATLRRLGFERVSHLARIPRAMLARRFGPLPGLRLDQAHGRVDEPLTPLAPEQPLQRRIAFLEPLLTAEALSTATSHLVAPLCDAMERQGLGARQLDLLFERVDSQVVAVRVGTARPSRDAAHLSHMLDEQLETVDPGLGIEAMRLVVALAEPLRWEQQDGEGFRDVSRLMDRLTNRLGADRVYRAMPVESELPERVVRKASPIEPGPVLPGPPSEHGHGTESARSDRLRFRDRVKMLDAQRLIGSAATELHADQRAPNAAEPGASAPVLAWKPRYAPGLTRQGVPDLWPGRLLAPTRLLHPPRPVSALAALPDQPPVAFTWRKRHRVRRADGPERIHGEWWRGDEGASVRDYYLVEDESGQRFWLFRKGDGVDARTGTLEWFLHGLF